METRRGCDIRRDKNAEGQRQNEECGVQNNERTRETCSLCGISRRHFRREAHKTYKVYDEYHQESGL